VRNPALKVAQTAFHNWRRPSPYRLPEIHIAYKTWP
jgi:hypothetical protein